MTRVAPKRGDPADTPRRPAPAVGGSITVLVLVGVLIGFDTAPGDLRAEPVRPEPAGVRAFKPDPARLPAATEFGVYVEFKLLDDGHPERLPLLCSYVYRFGCRNPAGLDPEREAARLKDAARALRRCSGQDLPPGALAPAALRKPEQDLYAFAARNGIDLHGRPAGAAAAELGRRLADPAAGWGANPVPAAEEVTAFVAAVRASAARVKQTQAELHKGLDDAARVALEGVRDDCRALAGLLAPPGGRPEHEVLVLAAAVALEGAAGPAGEVFRDAFGVDPKVGLGGERGLRQADPRYAAYRDRDPAAVFPNVPAAPAGTRPAERAMATAAARTLDSCRAALPDPRPTGTPVRQLTPEQRTTLTTAQSALDILTTALRLGGGDAARVGTALGAIGGTAIQIATLSALGMATPVTIVASVVGLIGSLFGLFGGGNDDLILEQLQHVRQDIALLRAEMHFQYAHLHGEMARMFDKVLARLDTLEWLLSTVRAEVRLGTQLVEGRLVGLETQRIVDHNELLGRFGDLVRLNMVTALNQALALDVTRVRDSAAVQVEFDRLLAWLHTGATYASAQGILAGGTKRFANGGQTGRPVLSPEAAVMLLQIADADGLELRFDAINDFCELAESAGLDVRPRAGGRRPVVNPIPWSLCVRGYLTLASRAPDRFRANPLFRRWLAEQYAAGEALKTALAGFSRRPDGTPDFALFDRLFAMMEDPINRFERSLIDHTASAVAALNGADPWVAGPRGPVARDQGLAVRPAPGLVAKYPPQGTPGYVAWRDLPDMKDWGLSVEEARQLIGKLPQAYQDAERLGYGQFALEATDIDFADTRAPAWHHDFRGKTHFGRVRLAVRLLFHPTGNSGSYPVADLSLLAGDEVHYKTACVTWVPFNPQEPAHYVKFDRYNPAANVRKPTRREVSGRDAWLISNCIEQVYNELWHPAPIKTHAERAWPALKAQLLACDLKPSADVTDHLARRTARQIADTFDQVERKVRIDTQQGIGEPGTALRQLYGALLTTRQFVSLAFPGLVETDPALQAMFLGDRAPWDAALIVKHLEWGEDPQKRAGHALVSDDGSGGKFVPLADEMRARLTALREYLKAADESAGTNPELFTHPEIDETLLLIVAAARNLGVDLEAELKAQNVVVGPLWAVRMWGGQGMHPRIFFQHRWVVAGASLDGTPTAGDRLPFAEVRVRGDQFTLTGGRTGDAARVMTATLEGERIDLAEDGRPPLRGVYAVTPDAETGEAVLTIAWGEPRPEASTPAAGVTVVRLKRPAAPPKPPPLPPPTPEETKALRELAGTYEIIGIAFGGKKIEIPEEELMKLIKESGLKIVIRGDRIIVHAVGKEERARLRLDPSKTPAHFTILSENLGGDGVVGIYKLEGGVLTIGIVEGAKPDERPSEFKAADKTGLLTLKKVEKP